MTEPRTPQFGERDRQRLVKLLRMLGSANAHEFETARAMIDRLLREFSKSWADIPELLAGKSTGIRADLAGDIAGLGSGDSAVVAKALAHIRELLAQYGVTWNDLVDQLLSISPASWVADGGLPASGPPEPEPVDLLTLIVGLLKEFVEFREPHAYIVVALWILHTFVYDRFAITPRLILRSPVPGCGKTVLLNILARLAARAEKFDFITAAALYHLIDEMHPTLLVDEADNLTLQLAPNGRLRSVFNSGHLANGTGRIWDQALGRSRKFSTFAPMALALPDAMGGLPRSLNSRSVTIMMHRHDGKRELQRLDKNLSHPLFDPAYGQILRWLHDPQLKLDSDPVMPVNNRFADNWRPLISIADSLGHGDLAREALMTSMREYVDADIKIVLLTDIRRVFDSRGVDRLFSSVLLGALHKLDSADWSEFNGVRGDQQPHKLKSTELASMLRDFGIRPRSIWPADRTKKSKSAKGYTREQFERAWAAYCSEEDGTAAHQSNVKHLRLV
jgi:hypothetical protein